MKGYLKILILSLFVVWLHGLNLSPALSQDEDFALVSETSGEISSIDPKKQAVVIKQLKDQETMTYENITICIDTMTTIEKAYEAVELNDLKVGDNAEIEYTTDDEGKNIATYIWVETKRTE